MTSPHSFDLSDGWCMNHRDYCTMAGPELVLFSDCCRCCYAAVERGDMLGHEAGLAGCPFPPCDWCAGRCQDGWAGAELLPVVKADR